MFARLRLRYAIWRLIRQKEKGKVYLSDGGVCMYVRDNAGLAAEDLLQDIAEAWPHYAVKRFFIPACLSDVPDQLHRQPGLGRRAIGIFSASTPELKWLEGPYAEARWDFIYWLHDRLKL